MEINRVNQALKHHNLGQTQMEVLVECGKDAALYNDKRQVFNRRFSFKPWAIVFPESAEDVSQMVKLATAENREIRVKGGGHDHEGECSATDALVLDMQKMRHLDFGDMKGTAFANIGVGWIFKDLIVPLIAEGVSIPHGTCQTVGITGYTLGGGWGPWTRQYGMCCEHLLGATIVLGDGSIHQISEHSTSRAYREILWALRGGGGFSYGIVTELKIGTFTLPEQAHKFVAHWGKNTDKPALKVLEAWEGAIEAGENKALVGTNLQIMAKPKDGSPIETSTHVCNFFGYYIGSEDQARADVYRWFEGCEPDSFEIVEDKPEDKTQHLMFSAWGRMLSAECPQMATKIKSTRLGAEQEFPLEEDIPAPHQLTSRLVQSQGLGHEGRKRLIASLESDLLHDKGAALGVMTYVTLGAISGTFYDGNPDKQYALNVAFPYRERPYTIQYQAWWNTKPCISPETSEELGVNVYTNRAMDWIEVCRSADFPETKGAFISFKDAAVPTKDYFMENYDALVGVKCDFSEDHQNRFRSRKTII